MAQYQSSLTGPEIDAALTDMARHDSEAWAVGTRDGAAVSSLDITYHNNAEYYATNAQAAAARAEAAVPPSTAGAVFFDRVQSLTDAQKTQARTNIGAQSNDGGVLKIDSGLTIGTKTFVNTNVNAGGAGWYRVAYIDLERAPGEGQIFHSVGTVYLSGYYTGYKPSKGIFNYIYDGGSTYNSLVQLAGVSSTSPTQIRMGNTATGHTKGQGYVFIDLYFSNTTAATRFAVSIIADGARGIEMIDPTLITGTPTGETVRATLTISTTNTGVDVRSDNAVYEPTSLAEMKTMLNTANGKQGDKTTAFYAFKPTTAFSPFQATTYSVELFRIDAYSLIATFKGFSTGSNGILLIGMANRGGTWSTPTVIS